MADCLLKRGWYYAMLILMVNCVEATPSKIEYITIAAENDWAPFSSIDKKTGEIKGLTPALVKAAFLAENIRVEFKQMPFSRCMRMAMTDVVVGCFNATETASNKQSYYWHKTPLFQDRMVVYSLYQEQILLPIMAELRGKKVGITLGYIYPDEFLYDKRIFHYKARSDYQLINMLIRGRVDYIVMNERPALVKINEKKVDDIIHNVGNLSYDEFKIAFSRRHQKGLEMAERFERGLLIIKQNGVYNQILQQFMNESL